MSKRAELIDTTPLDAAVAASKRTQERRLGRYGLALARDGTIRCVKCAAVVLAIPRDRPFAMGAPVSALKAMHTNETGCH
ncbi:MAG: hypothetical protein K8T90_21945 [Planctomycetes bacterium]|nr:hypothetical protein [Planctomycetota bacterium]